ncbi:serine hydrolase domain-containing protein [Rhizobium sp. G21]|uniref:serine hydrolase domain-containing protein n=1 Tax=Rhizobium sp. G21 TaxID=2758439 RepID=UPI0015FFCA2C|nr:serine hydrolase domain-containing protein [Rhizobium sp. G21]MBB1249646.1 beta-lactamase family protein [Rhizobium sp. G21]
MGMDQRLDQAIDRAIGEGRITGTVVLVHRDGEPVYRRAAGFADREAGRPVAMDTIFRLASVTKPFVAVTALAMAEGGLLSVEDLVRDHLPWFQPKLADGRVGDITLHHLLTHTAGLAYDPALERLPADLAVNCGLADTDLDYEANFSRVNAIPLRFEPGNQWLYSYATDLLGAVIAKVHGGTLEEAVRTHVCDPLGLADCRFHVTDANRLAVAYADGHPEAVRMPDPYSPPETEGWTLTFSPGRILNPRAFQSGGAGMAGTAPDVMTFLDTLARGGGDILSLETVRSALSNQIGEIEAEPGRKFTYVGALVTDRRLAMTLQPEGTVRWGGVYGLNWFIDPVNRITGLSVTNNALEGCTGRYPEEIVHAIYG